MYDLHCHILPGVDDGSRDLRESLQMLDAAKAMGIDTIVCTPHVRGGMFDYAAIQRAFAQLEPHAMQKDIQLVQGYEVYWQKLAEFGMEAAPRLVTAGTNLFLLEFSYDALPVNWQGIVRALQAQDLQVIIAHPERYAPVQKNPAIAHEMKAMGCLLQLSANFVQGSKGSSLQCARTLLQEDLVDYIASDAHCVRDYADYREALVYAQNL